MESEIRFASNIDWVPSDGGVCVEMPDAAYRAAPGVSQSFLKRFAQSPAHARHYADNPKKTSSAMIFGSAVDCALFEPKEFADCFVVDDTGEHRNSKVFKAWAAEQGQLGREILSPAEYGAVMDMVEAIRSHSRAEQLLETGHPQPSVFWHDDETGVDCKGRLDWWCPSRRLVVDLKTTADVRPHAFMRTAHTLGYVRQAAMYVDGLSACGFEPLHYAVLAVEKEPPHGIRIYVFEDKWIKHARRQYRAELKLFRECTETDDWPGYDPEPTLLEIPRWVERSYEEGMTWEKPLVERRFRS